MTEYGISRSSHHQHQFIGPGGGFLSAGVLSLAEGSRGVTRWTSVEIPNLHQWSQLILA
jgi:hypothetical protein